MKLPELRSAPVQRLALPEPGVEAAGYNAAREGLGALAQVAQQRANQAMAADYTDRYAKITNADVTVRNEIRDTPYMRVTDLPDEIEIEDGVIENRYDEETDTINEFVPTYEIADSLYQHRMSAFIDEQAEGSRNSIVGERLKSDSQLKVVARSREELLRYSLEQGQKHDLAKFQVALQETINAGDEQAGMEVVARAVATLGINQEAAVAELGSKMDIAYFQRGMMAAKTRAETDALRDELDTNDWRFSTEEQQSLYGMMVKQSLAQYDLEVEKFEFNSRQLTSDLSLRITRGMISPEELAEKYKNALTTPDFKYLLSSAMTAETGFRTPTYIKSEWDMRIEQAEMGYYPPGIDSFEDVKKYLFDQLSYEAAKIDPVSGQVIQRIAPEDFVRLSDKIQALEGLPFKGPAYRQAVDRVKLQVVGASRDAFMGAIEDPILRRNLDAALTDLNSYMRKEGPEADPLGWAEDNLKKYVMNTAREALLELPPGDEAIFVFTEKDNMVDYRKSADELQTALRSKIDRYGPDHPDVRDLRRQMKVLDTYAKDYPANVR